MADQHGIKVKRDRAEAHLQAVEEMVGTYVRDAYALTVEPYPGQWRYVIRSNDKRVLPSDDLAAMIGDCIRNMRSALDYIAWELAGARPTDNRTMFPIHETEDSFKQHGLSRIKDVRPDEAQALIKEFQPYNTPNPRQYALWLIEHFDAADKHRLLTVTKPIIDEIWPNAVLPEGVIGDFTLGLENTSPEYCSGIRRINRRVHRRPASSGYDGGTHVYRADSVPRRRADSARPACRPDAPIDAAFRRQRRRRL